jgi:nucleoside-diphosphate-sugar epimerase
MTRTSAKILKAKKKIGYNPKIGIEIGIKKFVRWYQEYYKKNNI